MFDHVFTNSAIVDVDLCIIPKSPIDVFHLSIVVAFTHNITNYLPYIDYTFNWHIIGIFLWQIIKEVYIL